MENVMSRSADDSPGDLAADLAALRRDVARLAETMSAFAKLDATAECTCNLIWTFYAGSDAGRAARNACPVHAPKPAAKCMCDGSGWQRIGSYESACPAEVHAPKPSAEKP